MRLPRAKRGRTSRECSASVLAAAPRTHCGNTTPRIYYRSSASLIAAASIRHLSLPRSKPVPRRNRTKPRRSPLRDRPTRKTRSQRREAVAHQWMATVPIRAVPLPEVILPARHRIIRNKPRHRDPVSSRQLVHRNHHRHSSDHRRSRAEPNLLIQARHHRPPEITLV